MPERKDKGIMTKLVAVAMWSNFSAHNPVIKPIAPKMNEDRNVKINKFVK